jgi:acyl carrier protein
VLIGRNAPSDRAIGIITRLETRGARILVAPGDVADPVTIRHALALIDATDRPLRGIVHAAGVLDDGLLIRLNEERFRRVMTAKVAGAWNLHAATAHRPDVWLVMFSSAASLLGAPGQANYAAANAFLDALAAYRRARGMRALSINWGPWAEIGLAARPDRSTRLTLRGIDSFTPDQGIDALEHLLSRAAPPQIGVLKLNVRQWQEFYPKAAESPLLSELMADGPEERYATLSSSSAFRQSLADAPPADRLEMIERHLKEQLGQVLRMAASGIDRQTPLATLGLDSLMAIELRNRLEASIGVTLSATLMWNYPTIADMAPFLAERMELALEAPAAAESDGAALDAHDLLAVLGQAGEMSEDDLRRLVSTGGREPV